MRDLWVCWVKPGRPRPCGVAPARRCPPVGVAPPRNPDNAPEKPRAVPWALARAPFQGLGDWVGTGNGGRFGNGSPAGAAWPEPRARPWECGAMNMWNEHVQRSRGGCCTAPGVVPRHPRRTSPSGVTAVARRRHRPGPPALPPPPALPRLEKPRAVPWALARAPFQGLGDWGIGWGRGVAADSAM